MTPTGTLRAGYARVAGVVRVEVLDELLRLMEERTLPSRSRAVGAALEEWFSSRRRGVLNPDCTSSRPDTRRTPTGVLNPRKTQEGSP